MNENEERNIMDDPQVGLKWTTPQCPKCKFNKGRFCEKYDADRLEVEVDIYNCPGFEPINKNYEPESPRVQKPQMPDEDEIDRLFNFGK